MRNEVSAGAVIVYKSKNTWEVLLIRDMNGNLTFPKGLIEESEHSNRQAAARRESEEETGIDGTALTYISELPSIEYWYQRQGEKIKKIVYYYLFQTGTTQTLKPQSEEGISEIIWMPIKKALSQIGYAKTNMMILEKTTRLLKIQ